MAVTASIRQATGYLAICAGVLGLGGGDIILVRRGWQSITKAVYTILDQPILGPLFVGSWAGLSHHIILQHILGKLNKS